MRIRLLLVAVCIFTLPFWASPSSGNELTNSVPFAGVAIAGHVLGGGSSAYCDCGCPDCRCDPGETPSDCQPGHAAVEQTNDSSDDVGPVNEAPDLDFDTGALLLALALFAWTRFRA